MVLGLLAAYHSLPSLADDSHGDDLLVSPLALWPPCLSPERLARVQPICVSDDYERIRLGNGLLAQLHSNRENLETLCNVDTTIVRSLQDCVIARPGTRTAVVTGLTASDLEIYAAQEWRARGEFRRADQLYQHLLEGYSARWLNWWHRKDEYCNWTRVKRALGEWDAARQLAARCVAHAEEMYDCDRNWLSSLVRALELQVEILQEAPDTEKAERVRSELNYYKTIANEDCIEDVCRGSPKFDGICWRHLSEKR